ncbi:MAG: amidohydrolase, partial [Acidimicrobiia bacterium]|nr:amidohydrolase [Acidimicrobiia bacterium]
ALSEMAAAHPDHGPSLFEEEGVTYLAYPGRARLGPLPRGIFDPEVRISEMDDQRVDVQVIAIAPPNYFYHAPANVGAEFATIQNNHLLALSDSNPDRFHVFGTLPLQDVDASLAELDRIEAFPRLRGIQIGTNINGVNLDAAELEPFWAAMEARNLPVWVHGDQRMLAGADRLGKYYLQNFIGQPLESTIAMGYLIFGGVLERYPNLRFGWVHGGGFLPYQIGRWDHGWSVRTEAVQVIADTPPSAYFKKMWFDTLTHDPLSLDFLGRRVGWDHVVLGSDYPFDMASVDPVGGVDAISLSDENRTKVLQTNAETFLRPL